MKPLINGVDIDCLERIPEGAGMFVANHNEALLMPDLFIFGMALHERFGMEGLPYGMGHQTGIGFPLLPDNSLNDIKSILPQLEVHRIEGPHLVLDTHPKTCARLVAGFLDSLE